MFIPSYFCATENPSASIRGKYSNHVRFVALAVEASCKRSVLSAQAQAGHTHVGGQTRSSLLDRQGAPLLKTSQPLVDLRVQ